MIWLATAAVSLALAFSTRADARTSAEAFAVGATEAHWLYRRLGRFWDEGRWIVCVAAIALVIWATASDGWTAWAAIGFAALWSGYVWRVAESNREAARVMREQRLSHPATAPVQRPSTTPREPGRGDASHGGPL